MNWPTTFRTLRGSLTQEQAAKALFHCPVACIRDWEQGRSKPPGWVQLLIAMKMKGRK